MVVVEELPVFAPVEKDVCEEKKRKQDFFE